MSGVLNMLIARKGGVPKALVIVNLRNYNVFPLILYGRRVRIIGVGYYLVFLIIK